MVRACHYLTIAELRACYESGETSPESVVRELLERIAALAPSINAYVVVDSDGATTQAKRRAHATAATAEPLANIPLGLKDLYDVVGFPTRAGALTTSATPAASDAHATALLRAAGAIIIGKHNLHEYALGVTNVNAHYGPVRNPWARAHVPGGSSGGTGAAIAAGLCFGGLGSDTGGSIRIPASLCGIVGLKPTRGRVSLRGVFPLSRSLDHAGPMARTVADVADLLAVIDGHDPTDPASYPGQRRDPRAGLGVGVRGLRVLVPEAHFFDTAHPETAAAVNVALRVFERAGATVEPAALDGLGRLSALNGRIIRSEAALLHADDIANTPHLIGSDVLARLRTGQSVLATEYAEARHAGVEWRHRLSALLAADGVLVTPTTRFAAPPIEGTDAVATADQLTAYTGAFNLTGLPALSVPCGFTASGLPIGLQIVGAPGRDDLVLRVGDAYERATEWHRTHPNC